jgi:hypothetical protein
MAEANGDRAATGSPVRGSRKAHLQGSRPDLRVPVCEILLGDAGDEGVFRVYDSSGPREHARVHGLEAAGALEVGMREKAAEFRERETGVPRAG